MERRAGIEAQILFADSRAPGPLQASPGRKVKDLVEAPGSAAVGREVLEAVDGIAESFVPDLGLSLASRSAEATPVLKQVRLDTDVMLLAQFADAGLDRTGRAGYTMHGLLHHAALHDATTSLRRPIELFASPMWVRPVGSDEVEAASVQGCDFDLPVGPIGLDDVIGDAFLTDLDRPERIAVLPSIIEAFRAALAGEVITVLVVEAPWESASWIALLCNLVDPETAARLRFSTREDLLSASALDRWDYQVAAVIRPKTAEGGRDPLGSWDSRFRIVDTTRPPRDEPGDGGKSTGSVWTEIAETVLMSPVVTHSVRDRLDQLADDIEGLAVEPTWGLPVATLLAGADLPNPDAAVRWTFGHWPGSAVVGAELVDELGDVLGHTMGPSGDLVLELAQNLPAGVPSPLADLVLTSAVRHALTTMGNGEPPPTLSRRLTPAAGAALADDLDAVLAWLADLPSSARYAAMLQVLTFAEAVGLPGPAVVAAVRPAVDAVAAELVDPGFDPGAAGWPTLPPTVWSGVFVDAVADLLENPDLRAEVSPATHRWLEPSLEPVDRPDHAVRTRDLVMSPYGYRRAAWWGSASTDPWSAAVFAMGLMHVLEFRYSEPHGEAVTHALTRAFHGHAVPVPVAEAIIAALEIDDPLVPIAVACTALSDGEFRRDQQRLAARVRPHVPTQVAPMRPDIAPVYLQLVYRRLVHGAPHGAVEPRTVRIAAYVAQGLADIGTPALLGAARTVVLQWGLRLPVSAVCGPRGVPADDAAITALAAVDVDAQSFEDALRRTLERDDPATTEVVAMLLARAGLVLLYDPPFSERDPYVEFLGARDARHNPLIVRGPIADWLAERDADGVVELDHAWETLIAQLVTDGWSARAADLRADRTEILSALDRASGTRRRHRRRRTG